MIGSQTNAKQPESSRNASTPEIIVAREFGRKSVNEGKSAGEDQRL
jgi:hypothetical protein